MANSKLREYIEYISICKYLYKMFWDADKQPFAISKSQKVTQQGQSDRGRCYEVLCLGAGICFLFANRLGGSLVSRHAREVDEEVCVGTCGMVLIVQSCLISRRCFSTSESLRRRRVLTQTGRCGRGPAFSVCCRLCSHCLFYTSANCCFEYCHAPATVPKVHCDGRRYDDIRRCGPTDHGLHERFWRILKLRQCINNDYWNDLFWTPLSRGYLGGGPGSQISGHTWAHLSDQGTSFNSFLIEILSWDES